MTGALLRAPTPCDGCATPRVAQWPTDPRAGLDRRDNGAATMHSRRAGLGGRVNTNMLFTDDQVIAMQLSCCILAGISLIFGSIICYWMFRMKKVFRHKYVLSFCVTTRRAFLQVSRRRLILLLMLADVLRSIWLFVFPLVSLVQGAIPSHSPFCQASGFFSNVSYDMAGEY